MTPNQFEKLLADQADKLQALTRTKGKEYARDDDDKLANFKRLGKSLNLSPEAVLFVYLSKHLDAITYYVSGQKWSSPRDESSEPIEGRIDDAILYLILLKGLLADRFSALPNGGPGVYRSNVVVVRGGGGGKLVYPDDANPGAYREP